MTLMIEALPQFENARHGWENNQANRTITSITQGFSQNISESLQNMDMVADKVRSSRQTKAARKMLNELIRLPFAHRQPCEGAENRAIPAKTINHTEKEGHCGGAT